MKRTKDEALVADVHSLSAGLKVGPPWQGGRRARQGGGLLGWGAVCCAGVQARRQLRQGRERPGPDTPGLWTRQEQAWHTCARLPFPPTPTPTHPHPPTQAYTTSYVNAALSTCRECCGGHGCAFEPIAFSKQGPAMHACEAAPCCPGHARSHTGCLAVPSRLAPTRPPPGPAGTRP